jgi:hypothetical protein
MEVRKMDTRSGGVFGKDELFDPRFSGEFEVFLRQVDELEKRAPEAADLSTFNDSAWRNFVGEVECADAARSLGFEADKSAALHTQRLRSERGDPPELDFSKSEGTSARQRFAILEYAKRRIASGEVLAQIIADSNQSTATVLRQLADDGEL